MLSCLFVSVTTAERQPLAQEAQRPNILFILTDDQTTEDLTPLTNVRSPMTNVKSLLVDEGTSFSNAFATTPLCCPSRVSFMRGQYAHNHGVLRNGGEKGGYERFIKVGRHKSMIATWLDDAGYATFYAGKFLNGYRDRTYVLPGWDEWYAFRGHPRLGRYTVNENGRLKTYRQDQQHETYYLRDRTEAFIRDHAQDGGAPWFAWVSTHAPHAPNAIAPEFQGSYNSESMPRPPSYNEANVSDKPAWIRALPRLDKDCSTNEGSFDCHRQVEKKWRARQEALMSVDVMVEDLVGALSETNQLERTYIVFASDNGFMLFQHRVKSKGVPYEESQGIPFVVRGPGVQQGAVSKKLVANIDLAPTIARWAGVKTPTYVDGRSLVSVLKGTASSWRQYLLFEHWAKQRSYDGVRTARGETYVRYRQTRDREYYDLTADPWQLRSGHAAPENTRRIRQLSAVLSDLRRCAGAECRRKENGPPTSVSTQP
jgi:N-acetylglucosamine-6-sulfatase